jgi:maltodextrin utilization protein YvdJ
MMTAGAAAMLACSVCFGASDSLIAKGTNMGIFFMLGVTFFMLAAFGSFVIYLNRRQRTS